MRILLIAYEFPPSPSPQSLRWAYLCRHLSAMGHRITVLTIHLGGQAIGLPQVGDHVLVHRTYAGPIRGTLAAIRDRRSHDPSERERPDPAGEVASPRAGSRQGWKLALSNSVQGLAARVMFPDVRGEWMPWAKRRLHAILREDRPDVVISSHEPATSLELGLIASGQGIPWVADLGDPVLAGYTPARWRKRSLRLEREVCARASHILVTTRAAAELLAERHGRHDRVGLVPQGHAAGSLLPPSGIDFDPARLELAYTGSFYAFRRPDALLEAMHAFPEVRLNIATITLPESVVEAARRMPGQVRLLGFLPHQQAIAMQRAVDVLVNIGNADPAQIPGKIYEYLGSQRPILHLGSADDAIGKLLARLRRGWSCANDGQDIAAWIQEALRVKKTGLLTQGLDLGLVTVDAWNWERLAAQVDAILSGVVADPSG